MYALSLHRPHLRRYKMNGQVLKRKIQISDREIRNKYCKRKDLMMRINNSMSNN